MHEVEAPTLEEHEHRLDDLSDRFNAVFPSPDTPAGAAHRIRLEVPAPASVMTIGARGAATSEGRPIGPDGIAARTDKHLGIEILGNSVLDTTGNTILHSAGEMRLLAGRNLAISSNAGVFVGSGAGNVELTAGDAGFSDPEFTVVPSQNVPSPPEVDTRSPRETAESVMHAWENIWRGIKTASKARSFLRSCTQGASPPSIAPRAAEILGAVDGFIQSGRFAIEVAIAAVEYALDSDGDDVGAHGPELIMHGAGGVSMTTPRKVAAFGIQGVKIETPNKVEVQGGVNASLNSACHASVYGAMCAGLKSDGVANISATTVGVSGDYVELTGREAAALSTGGALGIEAASFISMSSPSTTVIGDTLSLAGNQRLEAFGHEVHTEARNRYVIKSATDTVRVEAARRIEVQVGSGRIEATDSSVQLHVGSFGVAIGRDSLRVGSTVSVRNREVVIRGRARLC